MPKPCPTSTLKVLVRGAIPLLCTKFENINSSLKEKSNLLCPNWYSEPPVLNIPSYPIPSYLTLSLYLVPTAPQQLLEALAEYISQMNSKVKIAENKQYAEQNQRVPACLRGTKLNNTWVNTAKAAIDKLATQEPSDL